MKLENQHLSVIVCIDSENIASIYIDWILFAATRKGKISFIGIYGHQRTLNSWRKAIDTHLLEERTHKGGKNAADTLIKMEAWMFVAQCKTTAIVLASHDGDFAATARNLRAAGCHVYGIGHPNKASLKLVRACTTYTFIDELRGDPL